MVCKDCIEADHNVCIQRNSIKDYPDCDCQHRQRISVKTTKDNYGDGQES